MTEARKRISAPVLREFCERALKITGLSEAHAELVADTLTEADLRGVHSHGVMLLPYYVDRLMDGGLNPQPNIQVVRETASSALLDGDAGLGQIAGVSAMKLVIEKTILQGLATVGVRNSSHYGAGAYYPMMALQHRLIGFATCNTAPLIAPWGGTSPRVGNNPISIAIPAENIPPVVLDIAMSKVALGKITHAQKRDERIPFGWGLNGKGKATKDPGEVFPGGSLVPLGEHKGYGLAVVMEILAAVLTGAAFGDDLKLPLPSSEPEKIGHFYSALDPHTFLPSLEIEQRVDELAGQIKTSRLKDGVENIYLPGEKEHETKSRHSEDGIPLDAGMVREIESLGSTLGVDMPW